MSDKAANAVVVVPCFNEAGRLETRKFRRFFALHPDISFIFVNDGSTDGTSQLLAGMADGGRCRVLELEHNVGKAEAVRRGIAEALRSGDVCGFWDADLSTPLEDIPVMLERLRSDGFQCVFGSRRKLIDSGRIRRRLFRRFTGWLFSGCVSLKLKSPIGDTQCGAKLFTNEAAGISFASPFATSWFFDVEIVMRLQRFYGASFRLLEHPVSDWVDAPGSKVSYRCAFTDFIRLLRTK